MAPESLCFHEGRLGGLRLLGREEGYLQLLHRPSRAPAPAPGTCHQASSDSWHPLVTRRGGAQFWASGCHGEARSPLLPGAWLPLLLEREDVTASQKQDFFPPNVSLLGAQRDKNICFSASQSPRFQSWGAVPLTLSLHALPCCCCHHKLEPHRKAPGNQSAGEGDAPEFILRIFSLMPLFLVPSVGETAGGICVLQIQLTFTAQPWGCWGKWGEGRNEGGLLSSW